MKQPKRHPPRHLKSGGRDAPTAAARLRPRLTNINICGFILKNDSALASVPRRGIYVLRLLFDIKFANAPTAEGSLGHPSAAAPRCPGGFPLLFAFPPPSAQQITDEFRIFQHNGMSKKIHSSHPDKPLIYGVQARFAAPKLPAKADSSRQRPEGDGASSLLRSLRYLGVKNPRSSGAIRDKNQRSRQIKPNQGSLLHSAFYLLPFFAPPAAVKHDRLSAVSNRKPAFAPQTASPTQSDPVKPIAKNHAHLDLIHKTLQVSCLYQFHRFFTAGEPPTPNQAIPGKND